MAIKNFRFTLNAPAAYVLAAGIVAACTLAGYRFHPPFSETDIIMFYLVGAVVAAASLGRGPAVLYSFLSVSAFNYFFTAPYFTFRVDNASWWLTFAVMFFACMVISTLAARLREQVLLSRRRENEARLLCGLMKDLAAAQTREEMSESFRRHVAEAGMESPAPDQALLMETFSGLLSAALERMDMAQTAAQAKISAEKEKMRSTLLSSMSHDLRSPLAAISGAAETLLQGDNDNKLLCSIRRESARVTKIIGNLLDITRIEGGHVKLNLQAYDPAEIIGSAVAACRETLKDHALSLNVAPGLPFVRMDGTLISQLIQNLLENAARHTPPGTAMEIKAYIRENSLCLIVSDNGPGIPVGQEQGIFNKFATCGRGDRPKGTGLGLAICHAIVTAHGGRICAQNGPEGGARFVVELPPGLTVSAEGSAHAE